MLNISNLYPGLDRSWELRWNWAHILVLVAIWSYGFEAYGTFASPLKSLLVLGLAILAVLVLNQLADNYPEICSASLSVTVWDIFVFWAYISVLFVLQFHALAAGTMSLNGDQIYHAQTSQSLAGAAWKKTLQPFFRDQRLPLAELLRWINVAMAVALLLVLMGLRRFSQRRRGYLLVLLMLWLRLASDVNDIHPPLRLFPLWIGSMVGGVNDASFRLVSSLALACLGFLVYFRLQRTLGRIIPLLAGGAVVSIPLLFHLGGIVEPSIWTVLAWSMVLLSLDSLRGAPDYFAALALLAIFSLMRAPVFVGFLPLFWMLFLKVRAEGHAPDWNALSILLSPVLLVIPFVFLQIGHGTPATEASLNVFEKLSQSMQGGFALHSLFYNVPPAWVLCILVLPIVLRLNVLLAVAAFGGAAYIVFYSIRPILWGVPRYQAELYLPFVILGFVTVLSHGKKTLPHRVVYAILLLAAIILNVRSGQEVDQNNLRVDRWSDFYTEVKNGSVRVWSERPYDLNAALKMAKLEGYAGRTCKRGQVDEDFSEILAGYSSSEMESVYALAPMCRHLTRNNPAQVPSSIDLLLFLDYENRDEEIAIFLNEGHWKIWRTFPDRVHGSSVVGIVRSRF